MSGGRHVAIVDAAMEDDGLVALLAEQRRRSIRGTLESWCEHRLQPLGQSPARHHRIIIEALERVCAGTLDRLMILAPPGSAKSTYSTKLFVPYYFTKHPAHNVISASHTASLAGKFGRAVRNMVDEEAEVLGFRLSDDSRAADMWVTDKRGEYVAVGVGMAIAGTRADLVLIDDPFKSSADADSQSSRDSVWEWYTGDVIGRLKPGARIVLICTRWHEDDLAGRLLQQMELGVGDDWEVISFEALCEHPERDPLGRSMGEALWPEWEDERKLLRKKRTVTSHTWECQYQQNPLPKGGVLFARDKITTVLSPPERVVATVRRWDLAGTEKMRGNNPDWTVGLLLGRLESGRHVVLDVVRGQWSPWEVEQRVVGTAATDGYDVPVAMARDPGQAGQAQVTSYALKLVGYQFHVETETGSKETRATPVASHIEAGLLSVLSRPWTRAFLDEIEKFPSGAKDDQVDALAGAFNYLVAHGGALNILEYYRLLSDGSPTTRGRVVDLARDEYQTIYDELVGETRTMCGRCGAEVLASAARVSDGVSTWHPECAA